MIFAVISILVGLLLRLSQWFILILALIAYGLELFLFWLGYSRLVYFIASRLHISAQTIFVIEVVGYALCFLFLIFTYRIIRNNHFAGKKEDDVSLIISGLVKRGYSVISDPIAKKIKNELGAYDIADNYRNYLKNLAKEKFKPGSISLLVKPSQCGLRFKEEYCQDFLFGIVTEADKLKIFVWLDAEKRDDREAISRISRCLKDHGLNNFGVTVQANHSTAKVYLERHLELNVPVRLIKGAYADGDLTEKAAEINYNELTKAYFTKVHLTKAYARRPYFSDQWELAPVIHSNNLIPPGLVPVREFQFPFGINPNLAEKLLQGNHRVAVIVPWGKHLWFYSYWLFQEGVFLKDIPLFLKNFWSAWRFRRNLARP